MKTLLKPKVLIPIILSVALIVALLAFADIKKVAAVLSSFQKIYLLWFFLLMVVYEVVRGAQWHFLLKSMDIRVPLRTQIFAFAAGEVTKSMPIGNYFQNYLLQQSKGTDCGVIAFSRPLPPPRGELGRTSSRPPAPSGGAWGDASPQTPAIQTVWRIMGVGTGDRVGVSEHRRYDKQARRIEGPQEPPRRQRRRVVSHFHAP